MSGVDQRVAIRRKTDGKWFTSGRQIPIWGGTPQLLKTRAKAIALLRVDIGADLTDFDIVNRADLPLEPN